MTVCAFVACRTSCGAACVRRVMRWPLQRCQCGTCSEWWPRSVTPSATCCSWTWCAHLGHPCSQSASGEWGLWARVGLGWRQGVDCCVRKHDPINRVLVLERCAHTGCPCSQSAPGAVTCIWCCVDPHWLQKGASPAAECCSA
jgi:hypothetical protein